MSRPAFRIVAFVISLALANSSARTSLAQRCVTPSPDIVAWWPLDETSGTMADDIEGHHLGAHVNGPEFADGAVDGALHFDGFDDYIGIVDNDIWAFGENDFSIELWVNFDAAGGGSLGHPDDVFIASNDGGGTQNKWFFALGGGVLNFHINGPVAGSAFLVQAPFSPAVGQWYHLAITRNGNTYTIFVDGIAVGSQNDSRTIPNATGPLYIGQSGEAFGGFMNGRLDEVTIYNRALPNEDIQAIANTGSAGKCKRLAIDTKAISSAQLGEFFSQRLEAVFGVPPYSWSVADGSLPSGENLNSRGELSGTPAEVGSFSFSAKVTDDQVAFAERTFTLDVILSAPSPDIRVSKTGTIAVPGREIDYFILVENIGKVTAPDVEIIELLDPSHFSLLSTNPATAVDVSTLNDASLVFWTIPELSPGQVELLSYRVRLDPRTPLGSTVAGGPACQFPTPIIIPPMTLPSLPDIDPEAIKSSLSIWGGCLKKAVTTVTGCAQCVPQCACVPLWCIPESGPFEVITCLPCLAICGSCMVTTGPDGGSCASGIWELVTDCYDSAIESINSSIPSDGTNVANKSIRTALTNAQISCDTDYQQATGPIDPNEKLVFAERFIRPDQILVYPIHFENVGDIEARDVFVTDQLDKHIDISTLNVLTPSGASFNSSTRTVKWELLRRDLLPGETDNVLFSVKPLPSLPSGTVILNDADIQFEVFDVFTTNEVVNIIDSTPPACSMNPLPEEFIGVEFPISWTGSDAVGEVKSFSVFVSVDGGEFTPVVERTVDTNRKFRGQVGKNYAFFCLAEDTAGNLEAQVPAAETATRTVAESSPAAVTLSLPDDGAVDQSSTIEFKWEAQSSVANYHLQVSNNFNFVSLAFEDSTLTQTSVRVGPLEYNTEYYWRVRAKNAAGVGPWSEVRSLLTGIGTGAERLDNEIPDQYALHQNYPNPFNPVAVIRFDLRDQSNMSLSIYDLNGRLVATLASGIHAPGRYEVTWDATAQASGMYFYRLRSENFSDTKVLILLR